jgi:hypothetical protein
METSVSLFTFTYINSYRKHHGRRLRIPSFDETYCPASLYRPLGYMRASLFCSQLAESDRAISKALQ